MHFTFFRYIDPSPFVDSLGLDTAQQQVDCDFYNIYMYLSTKDYRYLTCNIGAYKGSSLHFAFVLVLSWYVKDNFFIVAPTKSTCKVY